jgi:hypothetical protein
MRDELADYRGILAVFTERGRRVGASPAAIAVRYSRVFRARHQTPRMAEILAMPATMPRARARMWTAAIGAVDRWLAGDHAHGCDSTPSHFGDRRGDAARALRMRWVVVTCPGSASGFWREQ